MKKDLSLKNIEVSSRWVIFQRNKEVFMKKGFFLKLTQNHGFSLMGVLSASVIGLIVVGGMTQLISNVSLDVKELKTQTKSTQLGIKLDEFFNTQCETKITNSLLRERSFLDELFKGDEKIIPPLVNLIDASTPPEKVFNFDEERDKTAYSLPGKSQFAFRCAEEGGCDCSKPGKDTCMWNLVLSTTKVTNNVPSFMNVHTVPLSLTWAPDENNKKDKARFECGATAYTRGGKIVVLRAEKDGKLIIGGGGGGGFIISQLGKLVSSSTQEEGKEVWATTDKKKTLFGYEAGKNLSTELNAFFDNTFLGYLAGSETTKGSFNTFVGPYAGQKNVKGGENTYVGQKAGQKATGSQNTYVGRWAGFSGDVSENSGSFNSFFGTHAGGKNKKGSHNTFVGSSAGAYNKDSSFNTYVGQMTGYKATGGNNAFFGYSAGYKDNNGDNIGSDNSFFGRSAGRSNQHASQNTYMGSFAGSSNKTSSGNTYVGYQAGMRATNIGNAFFGAFAGSETVRGSMNTFLGEYAGQKNVQGGENTYVGQKAGQKATGSQNTYVGRWSGFDGKVSENKGSHNAFFGNFSGSKNTEGNYNTFLGYSAGVETGEGSYNTFVGYRAGDKNTSGSNNVYIGTRANATPEGKNKSVINGLAKATLNNKSLNMWKTYQAGLTPASKKSHHLSIAGFVEGQMDGSTLKVAGFEVVPASSKKHKMDMKEFVSYDQALKEVTNIPLYTFRYKEWERFPWKERMGLVSETLPSHFQLPLSQTHTQVDLPTLTGSMVASIKALNFKVQDLEKQNFRLGKEDGMSRHLASLDKDLYVRGRKVCLEGGINCLMSSKKIKKEIKEFKEDEQALKDIVNIKLFNYKFKDKKVHTDKKRMGVLSEELPKSFQVLQKGELSKPDWPSLWGYMISSIKALYGKVQDLYKKVKGLKEMVLENKKEQEAFKMSVEKQIKEMKKRIETLEKENASLKKK